MKQLTIFIMAMAGLLATATVAKADQISALLTGYEGDARCGIYNRQGRVHRHGRPGW